MASPPKAEREVQTAVPEGEQRESQDEAKNLPGKSQMSDRAKLVREKQELRAQLNRDIELQRRMEAAAVNARSSKDRSSKQKLEHEAKESATSRDIKIADVEWQEMENTIKSLQENLKKAQTSEETAAIDAVATRKELKDQEIKLKDLELAKGGLENNAEVARLRIGKLEGSEASLKNALEQAQSSTREAAQKSAKSATQQAERIHELENAVDSLKQDLNQLNEVKNKDSSDHLATIERLENELEMVPTRQNSQEDVHKEEGTKLVEINQDLQKTIGSLKRENAAISSDKATLSQKVEDLETERDLLQDMSAEPDDSATRAELENLQKERSALQTQCNKQTQMIQELTERCDLLQNEDGSQAQINLLSQKEECLSEIRKRETAHAQALHDLKSELEANFSNTLMAERTNYERGLQIQQASFHAAINDNKNFDRYKRELYDHVMKEYGEKVKSLQEVHDAKFRALQGEYDAAVNNAKAHWIATEKENHKIWVQHDQEKRHKKEMEENIEGWRTELEFIRSAHEDSQRTIQSLQKTVNQLEEEKKKLQREEDGLLEGSRWLSEHSDELAELQRQKAKEADEERLRAQRIADEAAFKEQDLEQRIGMEKGFANGQTESLNATIKAYAEKIAVLERQNSTLEEELAASRRDRTPMIENVAQRQTREDRVRQRTLAPSEKRSFDQDGEGEKLPQKTQRIDRSQEETVPQAKPIVLHTASTPAVQSTPAPPMLAFTFDPQTSVSSLVEHQIPPAAEPNMPLPPLASAMQSTPTRPPAAFTFSFGTPVTSLEGSKTPAALSTQSTISNQLSMAPNGFSQQLHHPDAAANHWIGKNTQQVRTELNNFRRAVLDNKLKWSKENNQSIPLLKNKTLVKSFGERIEELVVAWEEIQSTHHLSIAELEKIGVTGALSDMRNYPWQNETPSPIIAKLDGLIAKIYPKTKEDTEMDG